MTEALERLGLGERVETLFAEMAEEGLVLGRVVRVDRGQSLVFTADGPIRAESSTRLVSSARTGEDLPAVGDWVGVRADEQMDVALVEQVIPRASGLVRKDPKEATDAQVLAANIDVVFIVHALADDPNISRIERELVLAWESGATPVVVLNKGDLCEDPETAKASVEAVTLGSDVLITSAAEGWGIDEVAAALGAGRTGVLLGPSGVGKSTIVNRLAGADIREIADVRQVDQKGRHTTVSRELIELPDGGLIIDTPGLRALALWDAADGMSLAFSDIAELSARCKFRDCTHDQEPGCAVRGAVESGELDERRLESYHRLSRELDYLASRQDGRLRAEREKKWKDISKSAKDLKKRRGRQ